MIFKSCVNCIKIVLYIIHCVTGIECCTVHANSETIAQLRRIQFSVDNDTDPCDDFYGHACNKWAEMHTDPAYDEITGLVDYKLNKHLINVIDSAYQHPHQVTDQCQSFVEKTRCYYKSCVRENSRNISRYFDEIKPGKTLEWPLNEELLAYKRNENHFQLEEWPAHEFDMFELLGRLHSYGFNNVLINQNVARSQNGSLQITLETPFGSDSDEIPPEVFMVVLKGWGLPEVTAQKYAAELEKTQQKWVNIYKNFSQTEESTTPEKLTYREISSKYPPLYTFLENMLPQQIQPDDYVVIANLDYFKFLVGNQLPLEPQNLSNYLMIKFLTYLIQDTTSGFTPLDCIKDLRNKMDLAVNYLYYESLYIQRRMSYNEEIVLLSQKIGAYFIKTLYENNLNLDPDQLKQLVYKIGSLKVNLGNFPENLEISKIEEFYKYVPALELHNYYKNHLELLRHRFRQTLLYTQGQSFFVAPDNHVGSSSAPIYIPKQHMVILPLGLLQPPIYHNDYPPLLSWSLLGFLLAHEFTHAIDTMGLLYGNDGHLLPGDPSIYGNTNFNSALECMQMQQATDAIDERLADIMGARVAYTAYLKEHQWRLQPSFLNIPWKKLFFLNMAQFFCGREDVAFVDHDTDAVRLREIVSNLEGFADAFQCKVGSKMNPVKKCRLY